MIFFFYARFAVDVSEIKKTFEILIEKVCTVVLSVPSIMGLRTRIQYSVSNPVRRLARSASAKHSMRGAGDALGAGHWSVFDSAARSK